MEKIKFRTNNIFENLIEKPISKPESQISYNPSDV